MCSWSAPPTTGCSGRLSSAGRRLPASRSLTAACRSGPPTTARSAGSSPCWPGTTASGCAKSCPRTSRWKASSPTCSSPEKPREMAAMSGVFNKVVASITLRAGFGRGGGLLFAIPPLILILVTLLLKAARPQGAPWPGRILGDFGFTVILPLTALIIGTSVLGAEIDDGSIVHLLATPVRRLSVVLSKFAAAVLLTVLFGALPEYLAATIAKGPADKLSLGLLAGALVASVAYNALFVMLSLLTTRAIAVGLLYVLIWEAVLGNFVSGARLLSVGQYSLGVANGIAHDSALNAGLTLTTAVIMGAIVTELTLVFASRRLSEFPLKGDAV